MGVYSKMVALSVANLFRKPFKSWKAFELGLIDEKGELIKKPSTPEEKSSLDGITGLIRKIKKVLVKYVGDSKIMGLLIASYILKESKDSNNIISEINHVLTENEKNKFEEILYQIKKNDF